MHRGERIEIDLIAPEGFDAAHHAIKGRLTAFVDTVGVVQLARTIDGNADKKLIFEKTFCPCIVEQDAIGLEGVGNLLAVGVFFLDLDKFPEIIDTQKRRFPALPGKIHHRRVVRFDVLPDVALQHLVAHRPLIDMRIGLRIEQFLFKIEAVLTVEIADGPDGLGQHMEVRSTHRWTLGEERCSFHYDARAGDSVFSKAASTFPRQRRGIWPSLPARRCRAVASSPSRPGRR